MNLKFSKTINVLSKVSSWKSFFIMFLIYVLFFVFIMSGLMAGSEEKHQPLDLLFSYTPEQAYTLIKGYGEARHRYALFSMTADTVYPLIYTGLFMILIMQLSKSIWPDKPSLHRVALFPLFALMFDLAENTCIISMIKLYPTQNDMLAYAASAFTSLKWTSVAIIGVIIVLMALICLYKALVKG